jgi:hypothetical protein
MANFATESVPALSGVPGRRLLVGSLRDIRPSPVMLLALAGLPVLIAAWTLLSPPVLLSKAMTPDLLYNLAGAWHVHFGQVPYVDFHDPAGKLSFILTAIGFDLVGPTPFAFLVNVAIVTAVIFGASFLAVVRRLPVLPAAIFVVFVSLLALMPANVGDRPDQYTFAMSYNRYGWSAYSILALILFVPPRNRTDKLSADIAVAALLLVMMFYFKITYFVAGMATVGFAVLFYPHVGRHWRAWTALCVLLAANAFAPYNHAYVGDILSFSASGAIRGGLAGHLNNFVAALGQYVPYFAAIVVACWLWWSDRASFRLPLGLVFLFAVSLFLLSQNSQSAGLPSCMVMLFILYDQLRAHFAAVRNREIAPLLLALLVFPLFAAGSFAMSLAGYNRSARDIAGLHVVDHTNLRGLAVPDGQRGAFVSFSYAFDYPARNKAGSPPPLYQLTDYEYILVLLDAADLLSARPPGGIAVLDNVNPLPFMLGLTPPRGSNLWSTWSAPMRPTEEYLADVRYVLIPKFSLTPQWTTDLMNRYGGYLDEHFRKVAETRCWILLGRSEPRTRKSDIEGSDDTAAQESLR